MAMCLWMSVAILSVAKRARVFYSWERLLAGVVTGGYAAR